jgi:hypothetical protein
MENIEPRHSIGSSVLGRTAPLLTCVSDPHESERIRFPFDLGIFPFFSQSRMAPLAPSLVELPARRHFGISIRSYPVRGIRISVILRKTRNAN